MAEWLYEEGIGEARAALIEKGKLVEALIEREGDAARAGAVMQGKLITTVICCWWARERSNLSTWC